MVKVLEDPEARAGERAPRSEMLSTLRLRGGNSEPNSKLVHNAGAVSCRLVL
jgi:hypothetical protein